MAGTRKITETTKVAKAANGQAVTREVKAKNRNEPVWDVRQYNFQTDKWEREGERRTYKGAYNRYYWLSRQYPYGKFDICLIPGRRPAKTKA